MAEFVYKKLTPATPEKEGFFGIRFHNPDLPVIKFTGTVPSLGGNVRYDVYEPRGGPTNGPATLFIPGFLGAKGSLEEVARQFAHRTGKPTWAMSRSLDGKGLVLPTRRGAADITAVSEEMEKEYGTKVDTIPHSKSGRDVHLAQRRSLGLFGYNFPVCPFNYTDESAGNLLGNCVRGAPDIPRLARTPQGRAALAGGAEMILKNPTQTAAEGISLLLGHKIPGTEDNPEAVTGTEYDTFFPTSRLEPVSRQLPYVRGYVHVERRTHMLPIEDPSTACEALIEAGKIIDASKNGKSRRAA